MGLFEKTVTFIFMTFSLVIIILGVAAIGANLERERWQKELIKKGYAHHNSITGEWEWNDSNKISKE